MKVIILGAGEVGFHIAKQLISEQKDVILIDNNQDRVKFVSEHLDCMVILGDGTNPNVLKEAECEKADFFVAVTSSDEVNMIASMLISQENGKKITKIVRLKKVEYLTTELFLNPATGIDYVVNHEVEAAKEIFNTVSQGATSEVTVFENTDIQLRKIYIDHNSPFINRTLKDIKASLKEDFLITGVLRDENIIIPTGNTVIKEKDHVYIIASKNNLDIVLKKAGINRKKLKNIVIAGGGKIGEYVAELLINVNKKVKIVDINYDKCKRLAEKFQDACIVNADISDDSIFEEEQLFSYDLMITTTGNEELNILAAIYAKTKGTKKALAMINKQNYLTIASNLRIDATVSPKISAVNAVLKFLRKGNIKSIHTMFDGETEVIEFNADSNCKLIGQPLKNIKLPKNSLIVAVARKQENIIPDGNFMVNENDNIIIFTKKSALKSLENFF